MHHFKDILRQQYHALSADPDSLANLDQGMSQCHSRFRVCVLS
jgi:hypothetical protein